MYICIPFICTDHCADITAIAVALPVTAVLCSMISSVTTALIFYYCITRKKTKKSGGKDKEDSAKTEALYDTPQVIEESSADIHVELKPNIGYKSDK